MIRMVGTRIIIPKGDTGSFYLINKGAHSENDVAVFSVKDPLTQKTVIEKIVDASECGITIEIENEDTRELPAGKYFWDLKLYRSPEYDEDGILIDALEIDSYYSAFESPLFIIKEVPKNV